MGNGAGCASGVQVAGAPAPLRKSVDVRSLVAAARETKFRPGKECKGDGGECCLFLERVRHPRCTVQVLARAVLKSDDVDLTSPRLDNFAPSRDAFGMGSSAASDDPVLLGSQDTAGGDSPAAAGLPEDAEQDAEQDEPIGPDGSPADSPLPSEWIAATATAEAAGELWWPARNCVGTSTWFSCHNLRIPLEARSAYDLVLEVRSGQRAKLGSVRLPLESLPMHAHLSEEVLPSTTSRKMLMSQSSQVMHSFQLAFQLVDSRILSHKKTVVFLRHAESCWNAAQSQKHFHKMAKETDHPLSKLGIRQAEELSRKLAEASEDDAKLSCILKPDIVLVSPLTRAVQTAVIALGPTLAKPANSGQMTLMANAREKQNFGGRDTKSRKVGASILYNTVAKLRAHYLDAGDEVFDALGKLHFNIQQVEEQWWTESSSESKEQVQARMREFMLQLLYSPEQSIVVVGHSHFFRAVVKTFLSDDFKDKEQDFSAKLTTLKLANCGALRLELDPAKGIDGKPIVDAELLLGSEFVI